VSAIFKLTMPKWGLSMTEGKLVGWLVEEGAQIEPGMEVCEVETDKIANAIESNLSGTLRRKVAQEGDVVSVSGLLGVVADASVSDAEIEAFIRDFQASFVPPSPDDESGPSPQKIEVGGRSLRYLKRGEGGVPAILLHGFGGDLNNWLFNHEALSGTREVYALDLPGHGESSKQIERGGIDELAGAVVAFMDALGIARAHLVGHSLGGAVAATVASSKPDSVASLTLIASAGLGEQINAGYVEGFIAARTRNELKPNLQLLFADSNLVTRQLIDDVLKYKRLDGVDAALRKIADAVFPGGRQAASVREQLTHARVPVLVVWGSEDQIIDPSQAQDLPGNARVEIFPRRGHMVQMEAAAEVNRMLDEFLARSART
jgi:pyruvate dehydrogenase E2 component (dihydrolipoamide acetyltransferase)